MGQNLKKKTLIGVLAARDDGDIHREVVELLDRLVRDNPRLLEDFAFVFTGGTFSRLFYGIDKSVETIFQSVKPETRRCLFEAGVIRLPRFDHGGVVLLAWLVVQRRVGVLWSFLTPITSHWLHVENIALMRLCDHWHVNRLLNPKSVDEWYGLEALHASRRCQQEWPPEDIPILSMQSPDPKAPPVAHGFVSCTTDDGDDLRLACEKKHGCPRTWDENDPDIWRFDVGGFLKDRAPARVNDGGDRIALIAHDHMKDRMVTFVSTYEPAFRSFSRIITTQSTGEAVRKEVPSLGSRIYSYRSGPKGGDIEIAAEIILHTIDVVIFFIDPLAAHPHIEDIRVVLGACMKSPVRLLTNEFQAREWMEIRLRGSMPQPSTARPALVRPANSPRRPRTSGRGQNITPSP